MRYTEKKRPVTFGDRPGFKRVLGRTDILTLAFGTMIGWAWVILSGVWLQQAGLVGALASFAIGAALCILIGLTYAELTAALPLTGGEMVYTFRALGYPFAWMVGWVVAFAYIGVAAWEGIAIATAIDYLFPLPQLGYLWNIGSYSVYLSWSLVGMVGAVILLLLNYFGTRPTAIFQVIATSILFFVGLLFLFGGITFGRTDYMQPIFTDFHGTWVVLLMVPSMFVGFDVIPQSAEEMNLPVRQIAWTLILSILLAAAWYFLIIFGMSLSAPPEIRNAGLVPAADAMAYCLGNPIFGKVMILGGICGIFTSWNGFIVGSTRIIYAMGRAGMLPAFLGRLHPRYKTPSGAIWLVGLICVLTPLLGKNALIWFVNASAFGSVIAYLMVAVAFLILRKKEPDLVRPFYVPRGSLIGFLAVGASIGFIFLYVYVGTGNVSLRWVHEGRLILAWILLGVGLLLWRNLREPRLTRSEQELLIFGDEYSRKEYLDD